MRFTRRRLDALAIHDEAALAAIPVYRELKQTLLDARHEFLAPVDAVGVPWDRAALLNLAFYDPSGASDVLTGAHVDADVVCHVAWHRLAHAHLGSSTAALAMGEAIASAFDLYLVGHLLASSSPSAFLDTQVPAMADAAQAAGLSAAAFEALLAGMARDPDASFEELRALLFDALRRLAACRTPLQGEAVLQRLQARRFFPLLHHYALSNWVLAIRAQGGIVPDAATLSLDRSLRRARSSVALLRRRWLPARSARA